MAVLLGFAAALSPFFEDLIGDGLFLIRLHAFLQIRFGIDAHVDAPVTDIVFEDAADDAVADIQPLIEINGPDEGFKYVF